jgi:ribosomal protein S18 acetylase RimI-like enzyme
VTGEVVPLSDDVDSAVRLGRELILAHPWTRDRGAEIADRFEAAVRSGQARGALYRSGGVPRGIAMWERQGPLGANVNLLALRPPSDAPAEYGAFLEAIRGMAGSIAFVAGELPGLDEPAESELMERLGFGRFARSEMRWAGGAAPDVPPAPAGGTVRRVGRLDAPALCDLHRLAYHGRFDRYLFLESDDEGLDAARLVEDLFGGRWGEFSPEGSWGIEVGGRLVAALLCVRRPNGVLIADVMVDPARQGEGLGRTILASALHSLAEAGLVPVFLNVTEGNDRAVRLYERLGFVRSLGPGRSWYDRARIPVAP